MLSVAEGIFIFLATTESIMGVLGNGFIGLVNCIDYVKNRKISKIDSILIGVALSRFCVICIIIFTGYIQIFFPHVLSSSNLIEYISYLWKILNNLSIWFATNLNIFYFLKIANFSHPIFLWLKRRIDRVFIILVGCLLMSWFTSFPPMVKMISHSKAQHENISWQVYLRKSEFLIDQILPNLGVLLLFMVALMLCFMLIISLWRHNRQMKSNVMEFKDLNPEGHVKAMTVLISFIILFILHFIGIVIEVVCFTMPESKLLYTLGLTATCIYPCGHSFVLIVVNRKLKQRFMKLLHHLKCCEAERNLRSTSIGCQEWNVHGK